MNRSSRAVNAALAVLCLALGAAAFAVPAGAASVHFEKESLQAYEAQLHHGQVHALTFHPGTPTGHLHISLNNGGHMTVAYAVTEQGKLVAQAQAANARVKIAAATTEKNRGRQTQTALHRRRDPDRRDHRRLDRPADRPPPRGGGRGSRAVGGERRSLSA